MKISRRTLLESTVATSLLSTISNASEQKGINQEKSVVFVWLAGGATHVETWDPKPKAPIEIRSINGHINTKDGFEIGGLWSELAQLSNYISPVRSFSHSNPSHRTATHWVNTGYNNPNNSPQSPQLEPAYGSLVSSQFGPNTENGVPSYVRGSKIETDKAVWLGSINDPFDPSGEGVQNLSSRTSQDRFKERLNIANKLDRLNVNSGWSDMRSLSGKIIMGNVAEVFKTELEPDSIQEKFGKNSIGKQFLLAKRLVEAGSKFVTVVSGGWDNHSNIDSALKSRIPPVDLGLSALISSLKESGKLKDTLIIVTSEFGRTYKINKNSGRDHFPRLSSLLLAGSNYGGHVIGQSDKNATSPITQPFGPSDLQYTIMKHFGIDDHAQETDMAGRPRYLVPESGRLII